MNVVNRKSLDAVTSNTSGTAIYVGNCNRKSVYVFVTGNTGAVTYTIQSSPDQTTWITEATKTLTATNENNVYKFSSHMPYVRVVSSTQSNSTINAFVTGGG